MHIASVGIDLGKTTFHLVALDEHGKIVIKKKFSRKARVYSQPRRSAESGNYAREDARFMLDVLYQREKRLQTFTHAL